MPPAPGVRYGQEWGLTDRESASGRDWDRNPRRAGAVNSGNHVQLEPAYESLPEDRGRVDLGVPRPALRRLREPVSAALGKGADGVKAGDEGRDRGPLLLISASLALDYRRLDSLVSLYDHYYERVNGQLQHRLLGIRRPAAGAGLDALPLTYRVLDENQTARNTSGFRESIRPIHGSGRAAHRVLATRSNEPHHCWRSPPGPKRGGGSPASSIGRGSEGST